MNIIKTHIFCKLHKHMVVIDNSRNFSPETLSPETFFFLTGWDPYSKTLEIWSLETESKHRAFPAHIDETFSGATLEDAALLSQLKDEILSNGYKE